MLAVQQVPRMGSTQPPSDTEDPFLPFGYNVDPNEPLFEPPEPAPGAPLLTETDSKFLSSFFEDMTANQYNMPSFGEGLNFSDAWLDLPPQFMGTATSFGQQDGTALASPPVQNTPNDHIAVPRILPMSQMMPPPPPPPPAPQSQPRQQRPSEDVLNAAATLLQNGSAHRGGSGHNNHNNNDFPVQRRPVPVGHLRHQPLEEFKKEGRRGSAAVEQSPHDHTFTEWMFGSPAPQRPRNAPNVAPPDFQWGSDSNFSPIQGYTPDPNKETVESQQKDQLKCLECFEVSQSTGNTRQNSPSHEHDASHTNHNRRASGVVKRPEDTDAPPRKRRKSKNVKDVDDEDDDEDDASTSTKKSARKRKPKGERTAVVSSPPEESGGSGKRRRSAAAASKASRENLSEEQKRENHIRSEQKRRTLIKEGFDDLCLLVPGLRGGGFSKSTMLGMTAEWLDDMLKGNESLAGQLASLGKR